MKNKIFKNMEWWIFISAILLCIVGFVALYSATQSDNFEDLKKQIIWFAISIVIMIIVIFVDYQVWVRLSPILYGISIILLIAVLFDNVVSKFTILPILSITINKIKAPAIKDT